MTTQSMMEPNEPGTPFNWFSKDQPVREEQPLTPTTVAADLCDADCPQVAVYKVTNFGGALWFCAHHHDVNEPALAAGGWSVEQLRPRPA